MTTTRSALIALVAAAALAGFGCSRRPAPPPTPAPAAGPTLTQNETALVDALGGFYRRLAGAMNAPGARSVEADEIARALRTVLGPEFERFKALTPVYEALPEERRALVRRALTARYDEDLRAFVVATAKWTDQFRPGAKHAAFRPVMRATLREWVEADAMWVFRIWSEEAVEEISEWALDPRESFDAREAAIRAGEDDDHVEVFRARGFTPGQARAVACDSCHADPRRAERDGEGARDG